MNNSKGSSSSNKNKSIVEKENELTKSKYLRHLSVKWDGFKAKVPQHECQALCVVAGAGENDEGVAS